MKSNIFSEKSHEKLNVKRNAYDKSFQNNLTMGFGRLYPCFCKEVMPNESISIKPTLGLNFMPMVFPVQTKMYVNLHFYYVRYRSLWKDWEDFITNVKSGLVEPYIARSGSDALKFFSTGSLSDYLNIPTQVDSTTRQTRTFYGCTPYTLYGSPLSSVTGELNNSITRVFGNTGFTNLSDFINANGGEIGLPNYNFVGFDGYKRYIISIASGYTASDYVTDIQNFVSQYSFSIPGQNLDAVLTGRINNISWLYAYYYNNWYYELASTISSNVNACTFVPLWNRVNTLPSWDGSLPIMAFYHYVPSSLPAGVPVHVYLVSYSNSNGDIIGTCKCKLTYEPLSNISDDGSLLFANGSPIWNDVYRLALTPVDQNEYNTFIGNADDNSYLGLLAPTHNLDDIFPYVTNGSLNSSSDCVWTGIYSIYNGLYPANSSILPYMVGSSDISDPTSDPAVPLSAFPYRAYESIYNSYYRRQQVDPFRINGVEEPNKWITTNDGGPDTTDYDFYVRDWEPDFLTTAFPSPQQGDAPLVGATGGGTLVVTDSNGVSYNIDTIIGEDGETITGIAGYDEGTPSGAVQRLMANITTGVSINDFRLVNSLQRYLERSLRAGYRYRDLMRAHHGVNIKYNPLDMPEFIGGFSEIVDVSKVVNQSALDGGNPLGSFAGLASAFKRSKHNISCFCDEHGLVMGIISVSPVPTYTQVLDKFWIKRNFLDYYNPEFARVGMQPISYKEVSPILRYNESLTDSSVSLDDTFGYQRAWYEYQSNLDQAHGEFRSSLRNFVMYRLFGQSPFLGKDFIHLNEKDLNNVFAYTESTDKILGQLYFSVSEKLPVLRHIVPGLE